MRRSLLAASASVAMAFAAFGDKTWSLPDGAILEYRGDLIGTSSPGTLMLPGVQLSDISILASDINTKNLTGKINERWAGTALPYNEVEESAYREATMELVSLGNGWGSGFNLAAKIRLSQGEEGVCGYTRLARSGNELGLATITKTISKDVAVTSQVYRVRGSSACLWGLPYEQDYAVYNLVTDYPRYCIGWNAVVNESSAAGANGCGFDQMTFILNAYTNNLTEVVAPIEDEGLLTADKGVHVQISADTALPGVQVLSNELFVAHGAQMELKNLPEGFSVTGTVYGAGGTFTLRGLDEIADLCFGNETNKTDMLTENTGYNEFVLFRNASLGSVTNVEAKAATRNGSGNVYLYPSKIYHYKNNGTEASFQVQFWSDNILRCFKCKLRQDGSNIVFKPDGAVSLRNSGGHPEEEGVDFADTTAEYYSRIYALDTLPGGTNGAGTTLSWLLLQLKADEVLQTARMDAPFVSSNMTFVIKGGASGAKLHVDLGRNATTELDSMPRLGRVIIEDGGELHVDRNVGYSSAYQGTDARGKSESKGCNIKVKTGGRLLLSNEGPLGPGGVFPLDVDGGEVVFGYGSTGASFNQALNHVTLRGGTLSGARPWVGHTAGTVWFDVVGSKPSHMNCGLRMQWVDSNKSLATNIFTVADVTGSPETDLFFSGGLYDNGPTYKNMVFRKTGVGTMRIDCVCEHKQATVVDNGFLVLGVNGVLSDAQTVRLMYKGGLGVATGTTNTIGCVTFERGANYVVVSGDTAAISDYDERGELKLDLEQDSSLTLNDVSFEDVDSVVITGTLGEKSLRIGRMLTSAELAKIRYLAPNAEKSKRVMQDAEGYITPITPLVIIFR